MSLLEKGPAAGGTARSENSLRVIHPYRLAGTWGFDDPATGLAREPFVAGIDDLLDRKAREVGAGDELTLTFAERAFPGANVHLEWIRDEEGGAWYYDAEADAEGWLCPALYRYFDEAPEALWLQIRPR
ncbi:MAG TPA: DUF6717 family protein [Armatimonadota bacterium]|nr:DUF6717 family protein [Armatimonadota bacterium]